MSVIKLRGLPWSCTVEQIVKFLNGINIVNLNKDITTSSQDIKAESADSTNQPSQTVPPVGDQANSSETDAPVTSSDSTTAAPNSSENFKPAVYLTTNAEGRPSGEAYVEVCSETDLEEALKLNNNLMGQRYIEIFRSDIQQLKQHTQESANNASNWSDPVLRLRGLPYGCTKADIETFFEGLVIAFDGIMMVIDFTGRFNGEAFVQFETISDAHKALERHKQKISNRYIEIFRSNMDEMNYYAENSNNQNNLRNNKRGGGNFSNNTSRRDSRSDSSMFFETNSSYGNNRFKPYARNNNNGGGFKRDRGNGNNNGPTPLMSFNNNFNDDDFDSYQNYSQFGNGGRNNNNNNNFNNNNFDDDYNDDYNDNNGTGYTLKMRGLPFKCTENDINEFFKPLRPVNIIFTTDSRNRGRPSGECECDFDSEETLLEAMKYDKKFIGTRYIELFNLSDGNNSHGNNNGRGGGGGGGGGGGNRGYNNGGGRGFNNNNGGGRNFNNNHRGNNGRGNNNNTNGGGFKYGNRGGNEDGDSRSLTQPQSLTSLMNQNFSSNNGKNGNIPPLVISNSNNRTPPPPPPVPPPMPLGYPMMTPQPPTAMNNFLMNDMAQKMFTAAYTQFQQQQLQYSNFNTN